jgi:arylsulfatase
VTAVRSASLGSLFALILPLAAAACSSAERPRSVVLITVDTLRADRLGCYGNERPTSPRIDRLAAEGVRFENVVAQSSWTLPSMVSLMTGKYLFHDVAGIAEDQRSLAQHFQEAGHRTAGFVTNILVGREEGFDRGFDHFRVGEEILPPGMSPEDVIGRSGEVLTEQVLQWADDGDSTEPFFLYVHYMEPHEPYNPPAEHLRAVREGFPLEGEGLRRYERFVSEHPALRDAGPDHVELLRETVDLYDGEVRYLDDSIAALLDGLEERGLLEHTVVALTADHGEGLYDHPRLGETRAENSSPELADHLWLGHGHYLFQELVRVPLVIAGPGILRGRVVDTAVANVDILPTLLSLAGVGAPSGGDGRDLRPVLVDAERELRSRGVLFSHCDNVTAAVHPELGIKLVEPTSKGLEQGMSTALFHLVRDPFEDENLLDVGDGSFDDVAENLGDVIRDAREARSTGRAEVLSPATREKLRQLGYTE